MSKNSNAYTISIALVLCLVCSVAVSAVAVGLKDRQVANARLDITKNVLLAAGQYDPATDTDESVAQKFSNFEIHLVNLATGEFIDESALSSLGIDSLVNYDNATAGRSAILSQALEDDPAGINRVPTYGKIYLERNAQGAITSVVIPVYGYGLWGTMYGFLTLGEDLNTVKGISFYQHKETPGLGALITEDWWRNQWEGIKAYNDQNEVATGVTKAGHAKENWVDGISGATLTSRGVSNMVQFWLGERGYKPTIDALRTTGAPDIQAATATLTQSL